MRVVRWGVRQRVLALGVVALVLAGLAAPAGARPATQVGPVADAPRFPAPAPGTAAVLAARAAWPADAVPGRVLVTSDSPAAAAALRTAAVPDGRGLALPGAPLRMDALGGRVTALHVPAGREASAAAALRARPGVTAVEPVRTRTTAPAPPRTTAPAPPRATAAVPDDRAYDQQWSHQQTGIEAAWDRTTGDPARTVAVIDTGIVAMHPELAAAVTEQVTAADGTVRDVGAGVDNDACDDGHGTRVAGIVAAAGDDGRGVAGVNWRVSVLDIAVTSPETGCTIADDAVIAGIAYATARRVDVVNLSLGGPQGYCPAAFQSTIDEARAAGVVVVAAAGNEEERAGLAGVHQVPASCAGVIAVGASRVDGSRAAYSTTNDQVDLLAPGGDASQDGLAGMVLTTTTDGGTGTTEGTSFSAPYVAGVAALLRALEPALSPDAVEAAIEATAADAGVAGRDPAHGWGLLRAGAAAELVAAGAAPGAPEPDPAFPVGGGDAADLTTPPDAPEVVRVGGGEGRTEAVTQAAAVSRAVFADGAAQHAVLARADDYADALAGSALGFGVGPLLFTGSWGPLDPATAEELQRVLGPGGLVYLLGGPAALPATLEEELGALGYQVVRLAGAAREETAVAVARELDVLLRLLGVEPLPIAMVATRGNWPDAVSAGAFASYFGVPIYLTPPDRLHPLTAEALRARPPEVVYLVGGEAVVSAAAREDVVAATGLPGSQVARLAGGERNGTAVAVAHETLRVLDQLYGTGPGVAVATNVRRADGFAHVLSASVIAGRYGGVFVPVDGLDGGEFTPLAQELATGLGVTGVVAGGVDLVTERSATHLADLLQDGLNGAAVAP